MLFRSTAGTLFGVDRLEAVLAAQQLKGISAHALVQSLEQGVAVFVGTAAPADDLTILVVRWNGPAA